MKLVLETIIKNIVENKDSVVINEVQREQALVYQVKVDQSEVGKIIGKQGKTAKAIRTIMRVAGIKEGKKIIVEIVD